MNFSTERKKAPPTTVLAAEGVCVTCIFDGTNQGEALYIINSAGIAYHQHALLHLIKPQGGMHGYAVMIYHRKAMDDIQPRRG